MRGFLAVLQREIVERRLLAAAALGLALFPLALPLLPGARGNPSDLRIASAVVLALLLSGALALILGGSIIARDVAERRIGFYFARPLSGSALWAGKLVAAFVLALGTGTVVLLPTALVEGALDFRGWSDRNLVSAGTALSFWVVSLLLLLLLAHGVMTVVRSRSPWLFLDVAALCAVGLLVWDSLQRFALIGSVETYPWVPAGLVAAAVLGLLTGSAVQVCGGRTDPRRGHRLFSLTLWACLGAAALLSQGYVQWLGSAEPGDLDGLEPLGASPSGSWIAFTGHDELRVDLSFAFLFDVGSGRFVRLNDPKAHRFLATNAPTFSADGRWAVWLEPERRGGPFDLLRLDLRDPKAGPAATAVSMSRYPSALALSADGVRIATVTGRDLVIQSLPEGSLLASVRLPWRLGWGDHLQFAGPGRVRLYRMDQEVEGQRIAILEMAVPGGRLSEVGEIANPGLSVASVSPDGERLLLETGRRVRFFDGRTGDLIAEDDGGNEAFSLRDGRIAVVRLGKGWRELRILSPGLAEERRFHFRGARALRVAGQPAPNRLVVAFDESRTTGGLVRQSRLLDLTTGAVRDLGAGLEPFAGPQTGPGAASKLFRRGNRLVLLDLDRGTEKTVLRWGSHF